VTVFLEEEDKEDKEDKERDFMMQEL